MHAWRGRRPAWLSRPRPQSLEPTLKHSTPPSAAPSALGPRYLSRLAAHKEVAEELAGRALGISGHEGKLAVGWAPGGVEYAPQGVSHQEHLGMQQAHRPPSDPPRGLQLPAQRVPAQPQGPRTPAGRPPGSALQPARPASGPPCFWGEELCPPSRPAQTTLHMGTLILHRGPELGSLAPCCQPAGWGGHAKLQS